MQGHAKSDGGISNGVHMHVSNREESPLRPVLAQSVEYMFVFVWQELRACQLTTCVDSNNPIDRSWRQKDVGGHVSMFPRMSAL